MNFLMTRIFSDAGFGETSLSVLERNLVAKRYEAGEHLIHQGEQAPNLYMIRQGLVKLYYVTAEGKEFVKSFLPEGSLVGSLAALLNGELSTFSVVCLEPVEAELVPFDVMQNVFESDPAALKFGFMFFQGLALRKEQREYSFLCKSPEERYQKFVDDEPDMVKRVTQADIARYLGITPVALSRIRKRLRD